MAGVLTDLVLLLNPDATLLDGALSILEKGLQDDSSMGYREQSWKREMDLSRRQRPDTNRASGECSPTLSGFQGLVEAFDFCVATTCSGTKLTQ